MPNAMPEEVKDQIVELIGCKREDIIEASGKTGLGVSKFCRRLSSGYRIPKVFRISPYRL